MIARREYVQTMRKRYRAAEGRSKLEIMRCLRRYVAREIYHLIKQRNTEFNQLPLAA